VLCTRAQRARSAKYTSSYKHEKTCILSSVTFQNAATAIEESIRLSMVSIEKDGTFDKTQNR
jgi:hypothetical protein